jgi:hypothetical protein
MWLLAVAAIGLVLPGGIFSYWLFHDAVSLQAALADRLAVAFGVDLAGSTLLLGFLFARRPIGPVKWPWFLVLSFLGTLWFGIPMYLWLNWRRAPAPRPTVLDWWRGR